MDQEQTTKLILLNGRDEYLIGEVTELDEEPSILVQNCYEVKDEELLLRSLVSPNSVTFS